MKKIVQKAFMLLALVLLSTTVLAEEKHVWASQGDIAFFTENGKIGLQTLKGEVLHEAIFDKASYFDQVGQATVYVGNKAGRIDRSGKMLIKPFECNNIWLDTDSAGDLLIFDVGEGTYAEGKIRYGMFSLDGKMISEAKWCSLTYSRFGFLAKEGDKYYLIDRKGNVINNEGWEEYHEAWPIGVYIVVNEKRVELNSNFEKIAVFDNFTGANGKSSDWKNAKIFLDGQVYTKESWTNFSWLSEDYYAFKKDDKWGVVDKKMNEISPPIWEQVCVGFGSGHKSFWNYDADYSAPKGMCAVSKGYNQYGWMDKTGKIVLEAKYSMISPVGENLWLASFDLDTDEEGDHIIVNEKGEIVKTIPRKVGGLASYGEGYIGYSDRDTNDWGFLNNKGEILSRINGTITRYNGGLVSDGQATIYCVGEDGALEIGFTDVYGNITLSRDWKDISFFNQGFAIVETEEGFRYINHKGEVVGGEEWDYLSDYFLSGNLILAQVGKLNENNVMEYGYINDKGELICVPNLSQYE